MIRPDYIQHNPRVPTGREPFLALLDNLKKHDTRIQNVRIFQDERHVIMHHLWKNAVPFGAQEKVAFHIIRFDDADMIAEHWSVMTDFSAENPSQRTLIDGENRIGESPDTRSNKAKVAELYRLLISAERLEYSSIFKDFFAPDFKQHHPKMADGIAGFAQAVQNGVLNINFTRQHKVFGSGNFVLSISEGTEHGVPTAFYDLFRLEGGLIVEHWSVYQEIPLVGLANDNTMFNF
jgi:predicted SnoaL-like aldol condensation-catalyzing enzyme